MAQVSQKIIEEISDKQLKPKPRSYFLVYNAVIWLLIAFFIIFDGILLCVNIYGLAALDWSLSQSFNERLATFTTNNLPLLWLSLSFVAISFAYILFRLTDMGYKYRRRWTVLIVLFVALFATVLLYFTGTSRMILNLID
ncbi:MAG: hypothetical protein WCT32_00220 [Patescibacteria group bacterium]|jgi:hypothetical protein